MSESEYLTVGRLAGEVTAASGIRTTPRMIHNYESKGLIETPLRSSGGIRLYPAGSVERVILIKELQRDHDLSLVAIRHLLESDALPRIPGGSTLLSARGTTSRGARGIQQRVAGGSRREALVAAADSVLRARGYHEATIEDIAREAGVAKGTFYLYFENKEQLFVQVLREAVQSLGDHLEQSLEGVTDPVDRLERRAISYMRGYLNYRDLIHILYGEAVGGNALFSREFRSIYEKTTSTLEKDVQGVSDSLGAHAIDPELMAYALVGAGEMLAYRVMLDDRYDLEDVVSRAMEWLRRLPRGSVERASSGQRGKSGATDRTVIFRSQAPGTKGDDSDG